MRYCCIGSEIFRCENTSGSIAILAEFSNYLFFSADVEEWRCSGTVCVPVTSDLYLFLSEWALARNYSTKKMLNIVYQLKNKSINWSTKTKEFQQLPEKYCSHKSH